MNATMTPEAIEQPTVDRWTKMAHAAPAYRHIVRRAQQAREQMSEALEDRVHAARRAARRRMHDAEDLRDLAAVGLRHRPFRSVGVAFAAGTVVGALVAGAAFVIHDRS